MTSWSTTTCPRAAPARRPRASDADAQHDSGFATAHAQRRYCPVDGIRTRRRADRRRRPVRHRRRAATCRRDCPGRTFAILEAPRRDRRHLGPVPLPGHPLGLGHVHARLLVPAVDGGARRSPTARRSCDYIRDTAREYGVDRHIRFDHRVVARRVVDRGRALDGRRRAHRHRRDACELTCGFLLRAAPATTATTRATRPDFAGARALRRADRAPAALAGGPRLRRQARRRDRQRRDRGDARARRWPSGAAHVTMLQRSPSYVVSLPARGPDRRRSCARCSRPSAAYAIVRWKNVLLHAWLSSSSAGAGRSSMKRAASARASSSSCPPATTSTRTSRPRYNPWDQRLCLVPDGDLFKAIRSGRGVGRDRPRSRRSPRRASGCASGDELEADIIVTATGLNLLAVRRHRARGRRRARRPPGARSAYKGMMLSGVPNLAHRARLHERVLDAEVRPDRRVRLPAAQPHGRARLRRSRRRCEPGPVAADASRFLDFNAGYVLRSIDAAAEAGRDARRGGCTRTGSATCSS